MRAGKLRRRVEIQHQAEIRGSGGSVAVDWRELARVWAGFDPVATGTDRVASDQRTAVQNRVCRIRYRSDVTPKMRILDGNNCYEILDVADSDDRREIVLTMKSIEAASRG